VQGFVACQATVSQLSAVAPPPASHTPGPGPIHKPRLESSGQYICSSIRHLTLLPTAESSRSALIVKHRGPKGRGGVAAQGVTLRQSSGRGRAESGRQALQRFVLFYAGFMPLTRRTNIFLCNLHCEAAPVKLGVSSVHRASALALGPAVALGPHLTAVAARILCSVTT